MALNYGPPQNLIAGETNMILVSLSSDGTFRPKTFTWTTHKKSPGTQVWWCGGARGTCLIDMSAVHCDLGERSAHGFEWVKTTLLTQRDRNLWDTVITTAEKEIARLTHSLYQQTVDDEPIIYLWKTPALKDDEDTGGQTEWTITPVRETQVDLAQLLESSDLDLLNEHPVFSLPPPWSLNDKIPNMVSPLCLLEYYSKITHEAREMFDMMQTIRHEGRLAAPLRLVCKHHPIFSHEGLRDKIAVFTHFSKAKAPPRKKKGKNNIQYSFKYRAWANFSDIHTGYGLPVAELWRSLDFDTQMKYGNPYYRSPQMADHLRAFVEEDPDYWGTSLDELIGQ